MLKGSFHLTLAFHSAAPGSIPGFPPKNSLKFFMLLGFIDGAAKSKMDRGLKMSIKTI